MPAHLCAARLASCACSVLLLGLRSRRAACLACGLLPAEASTRSFSKKATASSRQQAAGRTQQAAARSSTLQAHEAQAARYRHVMHCHMLTCTCAMLMCTSTFNGRRGAHRRSCRRRLRLARTAALKLWPSPHAPSTQDHQLGLRGARDLACASCYLPSVPDTQDGRRVAQRRSCTRSKMSG